jgi:hypothetical protein
MMNEEKLKVERFLYFCILHFAFCIAVRLPAVPCSATM